MTFRKGQTPKSNKVTLNNGEIYLSFTTSMNLTLSLKLGKRGENYPTKGGSSLSIIIICYILISNKAVQHKCVIA